MSVCTRLPTRQVYACCGYKEPCMGGRLCKQSKPRMEGSGSAHGCMALLRIKGKSKWGHVCDLLLYGLMLWRNDPPRVLCMLMASQCELLAVTAG